VADLQFTTHHLLLKQGIFAHIGGNHFAHLLILKKQAQAFAINARII
jgi:hypothetical protein